VNVPPLITVNPPKNAQFREYEAIELPCEADGIPKPKSVSLSSVSFSVFTALAVNMLLTLALRNHCIGVD